MSDTIVRGVTKSGKEYEFDASDPKVIRLREKGLSDGFIATALDTSSTLKGRTKGMKAKITAKMLEAEYQASCDGMSLQEFWRMVLEGKHPEFEFLSSRDKLTFQLRAADCLAKYFLDADFDTEIGNKITELGDTVIEDLLAKLGNEQYKRSVA